jgi:carbonic anhydrase
MACGLAGSLRPICQALASLQDGDSFSTQGTAMRVAASTVLLTLLCLAAVPAMAEEPTAKQNRGPKETPHWDYAGAHGPAHWSKLDPAFSTCATGQRQSPINVTGGLQVEMEPVAFDYKPSRWAVVDNGHTLQVNLPPGNSIIAAGKTYELLQFHFHKPAEERVDGKGFAMVAHLVHKSADGKLAVVAVLMQPGAANGLVQSVWNNIPLEKNEPAEAAATMDVSQLLPARREFYTYMGSLTTPPCSEGVTWIVMKEPVQLAAAQVATFGKLYPMNARPIQARKGRTIKETN